MFQERDPLRATYQLLATGRLPDDMRRTRAVQYQSESVVDVPRRKSYLNRASYVLVWLGALLIGRRGH